MGGDKKTHVSDDQLRLDVDENLPVTSIPEVEATESPEVPAPVGTEVVQGTLDEAQKEIDSEVRAKIDFALHRFDETKVKLLTTRGARYDTLSSHILNMSEANSIIAERQSKRITEQFDERIPEEEWDYLLTGLRERLREQEKDLEDSDIAKKYDQYSDGPGVVPQSIDTAYQQMIQRKEATELSIQFIENRIKAKEVERKEDKEKNAASLNKFRTQDLSIRLQGNYRTQTLQNAIRELVRRREAAAAKGHDLSFSEARSIQDDLASAKDSLFLKFDKEERARIILGLEEEKQTKMTSRENLLEKKQRGQELTSEEERELSILTHEVGTITKDIQLIKELIS